MVDWPTEKRLLEYKARRSVDQPMYSRGAYHEAGLDDYPTAPRARRPAGPMISPFAFLLQKLPELRVVADSIVNDETVGLGDMSSLCSFILDPNTGFATHFPAKYSHIFGVISKNLSTFSLPDLLPT